MLGKVTSFMIILLVLAVGLSQAQTNKRLALKQKMTVTGLEKANPNATIISYNTKSNLLPTMNFAGDLTFNFVPTDLWTGYDLQSNGSPQEIWADSTRPDNVHMAYMWSAQTSNWTDRTIQYFVSFDGGLSFLNSGQVPPSGNRSGYGSIDGYTSDGTANVACHTFDASSSTVRAIDFKDDNPGDGTFSTSWDPGVPPNETTIWPRQAVIDDNNLVMAASGQTLTSSFFVNFYNTTSGWKGWQQFAGSQAETYSLAVSDNGTVGLLYEGNPTDNGNVYYRQTTDFGVTWDSTQIWQTYTNQDTIDLGCLRGLDLIFLGESPCAVFEVGGVTGGGLNPGYPSSIYFWNPSINGGVAFPIADTSNVPFYTHWYWTNASNQVESFLPTCKPNIGKAANDSALFVSFVATTPNFYGDTLTGRVESYYGGYFTYSFNQGSTWSTPVQFTTDEMNGHFQDYRFVSVAPVNPVVNDTLCTVQMAVQVDSIPGSQVTQPSAFPPVISATMYNVNTQVILPHTISAVGNDVKPAYSFALQQNYPNPFNPNTKISYSVAHRSNVLLKVYNMLGQEVSTIVNTTKDAGKYEVNFDASKLASGLYIYKIQAGNFTEAKKMMLLK